MIQFYDPLWIGKKASLTEERIRKAVTEGSFYPECYYIVTAKQKDRILEIKPCGFPMGNGKSGEDDLVIGLAIGIREAHNVTAQIIDTMYKNTGGFDLGSYLQGMR